MLADVDPGQGHDPEIGGRGLHGARVVVARVTDGLPGRRIHGPVRIREATDRRAHQLADAGSAPADLGFELGGAQASQAQVRRSVRADLHAGRGELTDLAGGHQRPRRPFIPFVRPAQPIGDDEHARREAVAKQLGQRRLQDADVAVVEGDADEPALAVRPHRVHERPDCDPPQATPLQPGHLLGESARRHAQLVRVLGHLGDAVIHQDHRHLAQPEPAPGGSRRRPRLRRSLLAVAGHYRLAATAGEDLRPDEPLNWRATAGAAWREPKTKRMTGPKVGATAGPTKYSPATEDW
jgi:hypothetical protein